MASIKLSQITSNLEGVSSTQIVLSLALMISRPLVEAAQSQWHLRNIRDTKISNLAARQNIVVQQPIPSPARCSPTQLSNHRWHPNVLSLLAILILLVHVGASIVAFKTCFKPVTAALPGGSRTPDAHQQTASSRYESDSGPSENGSEDGGNSSCSSNRSSSEPDDVDAEDRPPSNPGRPSPEPSNSVDSESMQLIPSNQNPNIRPDGGSPPPPPPGSFTAFFEDNFRPASDWLLRILHIILVLSGILAIWRSMPYPKNCVSFPLDLEVEDHAAWWSVRDTLEDSKPNASSEIPRSARPTLTQAMCLPECTNTLPLPRPSARVQHAVPAPVLTSPSTPVDQVVQRPAKTTFTIYDAFSIALVGLLTFGSLVAPLFILKPKIVYLVWRYYTTVEPVRVLITPLEQIGEKGPQSHANPQPESVITKTFTSVETQTEPQIASLHYGPAVVEPTDDEDEDEQFVYPTSEEAQDVIGTVTLISNESELQITGLPVDHGVVESTDDDDENTQFVYPTSQRPDQDNIWLQSEDDEEYIFPGGSDQDVPNTCQSEPIPSMEPNFRRLSHSWSEAPRRHSLGGEGNYDSQPDAPADVLEEVEPISRSSSTSTWVPDPDAPPFVPIQRVHVEETSPTLEEAETEGVAVDQHPPVEEGDGVSASHWVPSPSGEEEGASASRWATSPSEERAETSLQRAPSPVQGTSASMWASPAPATPIAPSPAAQDVTVTEPVPHSTKGVGASVWAKTPEPGQEEAQTVIDDMRLSEKVSSSNISKSQWAPKSEEVLSQKAEVKQNVNEGVGASMWSKPRAPASGLPQPIPTYESERLERPPRNKKKRKGQLASRAR